MGLGFCVQHPTPRINPLLKAGPSIILCIDNPGLIDSLKTLAPNALYIFRKYRSNQPLERPNLFARMHVNLLKPIIEKPGEKYDGFELYNEIAQHDLDTAKRFRDFQLYCLDLLQPYGVGVAVDNDPTWHPHFPQDWPELWEVKSEVYAHPAATWRCRHEYLPQPHYQGGYGQWGRHIKEIEWLRANNKTVLPHYIGEWGWDKGPPVGPWHDGLKVSKEAWIQGAKDYFSLLTPDVIGYVYFGAGLDQAWPYYNLTSRKAPQGIVQAVAEYMKTEEEEPAPPADWARVPEAIRRWYRFLADESFRHWPHQLIPFKGVQLHGDRIGAAIIMNESGGDPNAKSRQPALWHRGQPIHAWGLGQIIPKVEGHPLFNNRPTIEELLIPAINIKWLMAIFAGSLEASRGNLWEALRRYSGFAQEGYTMADFWIRYGEKFQANYESWWGIRIPPPEFEQVIICKRKLEAARRGLEGAKNIIEVALERSE